MGSALLGDSLLNGWLVCAALQTLAFGILDCLNAGFMELFSLPLIGAKTSLPAFLGTLWNWAQVALGLGFVIFIHELGHFLAAKTFGVRCDKFYVGFDVPISIGPIKLPRTLGKFQWGETEYGLGIIPLGGYVKMLGQDDDPRQAEAEAERIRLGEGEEAPLDPRSYPAKPVWQRMIIISAGVVMNLISAVFLAGAAYWYGVPYQPTITGSTLAGGPAWEAGIEPGDRVVRFGDMQKDNENLRYEEFAMNVAIRGFEKKTEPLSLTVVRDGKRVELTATPTARYSPDGDIFRLGLINQSSNVIGSNPYWEESFLAGVEPDLQPGDTIIAVDDEPLPVDEETGAVLGSTVTAALQAKFQEPVMLKLERESEEDGQSPRIFHVELPAVPAKTLGVGFKIGPVSGIQSGSAAEKAGFKVGDIIEAVNGEEVVDALRLPATVAALAGQELTFKILRPKQPAVSDAKTTEGDPGSESEEEASGSQTLEIKLQNIDKARFEPISDIAGQLSLGGLGLAFDVQNVVSSVDKDAIGDADIQVGDTLRQYHWMATPEKRKIFSKRFSDVAFEEQTIDSQINTASLFDFLQSVPAGEKFELFVQRDGKTRETVVTLSNADNWFWHQRGIGLQMLTSTHSTDSLATAGLLGLSETKHRFNEVLNFLRLLVTGKIGAKGVGGPLTIVEAASGEASQGLPRLLIFLTLLSANLAILNFLPIPALDGGHMVFLTAEAIRGKPLNEALQVRLTMAGVAGLLSLMLFVIVKDIIRYL